MLTVPLAVEKVLFRLALIEGGTVPIARAFLEVPLSLEEVEEYADQVADGYSVIKNEFGEFLVYEFPELQRSPPTGPFEECPTCLGDAPTAPTEGGVEKRAALLCTACYRRLRVLNESQPDPGVMDKVKSFFSGEEEEDPLKVTRTEHEIFYLGLRLGNDEFTHTALAAQSKLPSNQLRERLDRMAARRYVHQGLVESGDAVCYRFPPGLSYPRTHYKRIDDSAIRKKDWKLDIETEDEPKPPEKPSRGFSFGRRPLIRRREAEPEPREPNPLPKPPKKKPLDIKIKGRRRRGGPNP